MSDIVKQLREEATAIRDAHDPDKQKNGYRRCEHCHYTRHPCESYSQADSMLSILDRLESAAARDAEQRAEIERLREALTPSADTKAAYIGEFSWEESADDHRDKVTRTVPWTVVKEIMETIRNRAALAAKGGEKE